MKYHIYLSLVNDMLMNCKAASAWDKWNIDNGSQLLPCGVSYCRVTHTASGHCSQNLNKAGVSYCQETSAQVSGRVAPAARAAASQVPAPAPPLLPMSFLHQPYCSLRRHSNRPTCCLLYRRSSCPPCSSRLSPAPLALPSARLLAVPVLRPDCCLGGNVPKKTGRYQRRGPPNPTGLRAVGHPPLLFTAK